jgi:signal transduction histidine kinase
MTLAVSNKGDPIPEQALSTLFDPLTRARMPNRSGTAAGMGLACTSAAPLPARIRAQSA